MPRLLLDSVGWSFHLPWNHGANFPSHQQGQVFTLSCNTCSLLNITLVFMGWIVDSAVNIIIVFSHQYRLPSQNAPNYFKILICKTTSLTTEVPQSPRWNSAVVGWFTAPFRSDLWQDEEKAAVGSQSGNAELQKAITWAGANMPPPDKTAISLLLPLFLSSRVVGHWVETRGCLRTKPSAHHHPTSCNSSCWWWDQQCLPSLGLTPAFLLQSYLLAVCWCSFTLLAIRSSPTTHKVNLLYLVPPNTWHSVLHNFLAHQEALNCQPSSPSRDHMEGGDGSGECKGKEVALKEMHECFGPKWCWSDSGWCFCSRELNCSD